MQFIYKNGDLYYHNGKADKYIGFFISVCSLLLLLIAIIMKLKSRNAL